MNEQTVEDIISALYDMVQDARALPLNADKCILERDKVLDMLDEIIAQGQLAMREMGRLYASIPDAGVKSRIMEIINISEKIVNDARTDRKDIPRIRKFLDYYLPTTIKLLHAYDRMGSQGIEGENISGTIRRWRSIC